MSQANDNMLRYVKRGGDVGSKGSPGPPLLPPGGVDGMSDLEPRVRGVEVHIEHIRGDIAEMKTDLKDVRLDIRSLSEKLESRFYRLLMLGVGATAIILGVMAKGFKWY